MNKLIVSLIILSLFSLFTLNIKIKEAKASSSTKPNIIYIMVDDAGMRDFINPEIKSPTFDMLEKQALKFTHFYTNPTCSPTRMSVMTGDNPARYGVEHAVCLPDSIVLQGTARGIPRKRKNVISKVLQRQGYRTAHIGKWHLGERSGKKAAHQGFNDTIVYKYNNHYFVDPEIRKYINGRKDSFKKVKGHKTEILTGYALDILDKHAKSYSDKPLFLNLWYNAPHHPHMPIKKWKDYYHKKGVYSHEKVKFYGVMSQLDENIARVINKVKNNPKLSKNTIIFLTSDNGGSAKPGNYSNTPIDGKVVTGAKGSIFEGGIRVPLYALWVGGNLKKGFKNKSVLRSSDLLSTFAKLAGTNINTRDGESFASTLLNNQGQNIKSRQKKIFWHQRGKITYCGNSGYQDLIDRKAWREEDNYRQGIRIGNWKFVVETTGQTKDEYLFDFSKSEVETSKKNLKNSQTTKLREMRTELNKLAISKSQIYQKIENVKGNTTLENNLLHFKSSGLANIKAHDLYEHHDGSFTFAAKVKPRIIGSKERIIAYRKGSWRLVLLPTGKISLKIRDERSNQIVNLLSTTRLKAGNEYNIAFTISGHTGNPKPKKKKGCAEEYSFINNVARLYITPSNGQVIPLPEADNGADIYNVAYSGYSNPIYLGNSIERNQPFIGKITVKSSHSLALSRDQLKIVFDSP